MTQGSGTRVTMGLYFAPAQEHMQGANAHVLCSPNAWVAAGRLVRWTVSHRTEGFSHALQGFYQQSVFHTITQVFADIEAGHGQRGFFTPMDNSQSDCIVQFGIEKDSAQHTAGQTAGEHPKEKQFALQTFCSRRPEDSMVQRQGASAGQRMPGRWVPDAMDLAIV